MSSHHEPLAKSINAVENRFPGTTERLEAVDIPIGARSEATGVLNSDKFCKWVKSVTHFQIYFSFKFITLQSHTLLSPRPPVLL
jgi:hypothetical protein